MVPLKTVSVTTNRRGILGQLVDMWYGSAQVTSGSTYPIASSGSAQFVQFGHVILPWDAGNIVRIG
jgi:hypothetical protein